MYGQEHRNNWLVLKLHKCACDSSLASIILTQSAVAAAVTVAFQ